MAGIVTGKGVVDTPAYGRKRAVCVVQWLRQQNLHKNPREFDKVPKIRNAVLQSFIPFYRHVSFFIKTHRLKHLNMFREI